MKQNSLPKIFGLAVFLVVFLPCVTRAGFGVSPASIIEDHAVPGASFTRVIYLVQGTPDVPATVEVTVESRDIKNWISLGSSSNFTIPAGVQQFPLPVTITIPSDAPLGIYKAYVRVRTVPDPANQSGEVAISLGGRVDVTVTVGDDIVEAYSVKTIDIADVEEGGMPRVTFTLENTGNVSAVPDSVSFELFDKFGDVRLAYGNVSLTEFEKTPAFSEKTYTVDFPFDVVLATGEYWGHTKIYKNDGTIVRELKTVFDVHERTGAFVLGASRFFRTMTPVTQIGIVFVLLAGAALLVVWRIRRRQPPPVLPLP